MSFNAFKKPRPREIGFAVALLLLTSLFVGCGKQGHERAVIYGTVLFNGQPMPTGTIRFVPSGDTKTPPGAGQIINGQYRVETRGGVPVGTHKIEIEAFRPLSPASAAAAEMARMKAAHPHLEFPPTREQYIPARYNDKTELKLEIQSGSGTVEHNLELSE
ncbi:MAG: hypothetical protein WD468_12340 [Pirellulales bacterium]